MKQLNNFCRMSHVRNSIHSRGWRFRLPKLTFHYACIYHARKEDPGSDAIKMKHLNPDTRLDRKGSGNRHHITLIADNPNGLNHVSVASA